MRATATISLGEACEFVLDGTHASPERTPTGVPVLSARNVANGRLNLATHRFTSASEYAAFRKRIDLRTGDVLLTIVGTIGRTAIVEKPVPLVFQRSVAILRPLSSVLSSRYLYHALRRPVVSRQLARLTNRSAQAGVYLGKLKTLNIPIVSLPEQNQVAAILDNADTILLRQNETIRLSQELIPSAFNEMFGDPVLNPHGWPEVAVGDVVTHVRDGPHVSPKYEPEGVPFLSTRNIRPGRLLLEDLKFVSRTTYKDMTRNFAPQLGDVLLTKGGTTGLAKAVDFSWPFAVWVHVAVLRPKPEVHPVYLETALNSPNCYRQSQRYTHGVTNQDLGLTRIRKIRLSLPPLPLQQEFCRRKAQVDVLLAKMERSARTSQLLSDSLSQQLF
jgi:type I restriction enzyme, S subunit